MPPDLKTLEGKHETLNFAASYISYLVANIGSYRFPTGPFPPHLPPFPKGTPFNPTS